MSTFNFKTDERTFFRRYLDIISSMRPISDLRKQELDVLAELMYMNSTVSKTFKDAEDPSKWKIIFDYDNRMVIKEHLNITDATFANCLTSLRKAKILSKDNVLVKPLRIYPKDNYELNFNFILNG
jgi:hypothetical protein